MNFYISIFLLALLTISCAGNISSRDEDKNNPENGLEVVIAPSSHDDAELRDRIEQIAQTAQGQVGLTITVLETGDSISLNENQHFPMQSVYKFPIGMAVLAHVDQGKLNLEQRVQIETSDFVSNLQHSPIRDKNPQGVTLSVAELLKYMVSESDGTACDVLLRLVGGPEVVTQYLRDLGVNDIVVANTEKEIGQNQAHNIATMQHLKQLWLYYVYCMKDKAFQTRVKPYS